jgi:hypothetical protein
MVGTDAGVEIRTIAGTGQPLLLGRTERLEFIDSPGAGRWTPAGRPSNGTRRRWR